MRKPNSIPRSLVSVSRLFLVLAGTALVSSAAAGLPGQDSGWLAKMTAGSRGGTVSVPQPSAPNGGGPRGIEGTWRATGSFVSGGTDRALFTFGAGRDDQGTVVHSDNLFFVAAPSCLPAQGVWAKLKDKNFVATDEAFCFDSTNNFAPAGTIQFRTAITFDDRWTQFSGRLHIDAFDVDGNLVFSDDATVQGARMQPVA